MFKKVSFVLAAALVSAAVFCAVPAAAQSQSAAQALTAGEVHKVDAKQGKVTLKHEAIKNLNMDAMTMQFKASKPEQLKGLKKGDKVRFRAESAAGGALVVTHIEAAR